MRWYDDQAMAPDRVAIDLKRGPIRSRPLAACDLCKSDWLALLLSVVANRALVPAVGKTVKSPP